MTKSLTLAHFSDVHLTGVEGFEPRYWNVKRGLGYLNWRRSRRLVHRRDVADALVADARAHGVDHFAVTGDLVHLGLPEELNAARSWLYTLGSPDRVSVVPGNHDIYTARMHGASCLASWAPYLASCADGERLAPFEGGSFPYVRKLGAVALVGLNSSLPRAPFVAAGRLGRDQIERTGHVLERLRKEGLIRVVLIHHPPLPGLAPRLRALEDSEAFEATLRRHGAELVLHGHNHRDSLAWREWSGGDIPIVGVASSSAVRRHAEEPLAQYHLFRISTDETGEPRIVLTTRGLLAEGGAIGEIGTLLLRRT